MMKINLKEITTQELENKLKYLSSTAEQLRKDILNKCDKLEVLYKELILIDDELKERKNGNTK